MLAKIFGLIIMGFSLILISKNDLGGVNGKQDVSYPPTTSAFPLQTNHASFYGLPVFNNLNKGFKLSYTSWVNSRFQEQKFPQKLIVDGDYLEAQDLEKANLPLVVSF